MADSSAAVTVFVDDAVQGRFPRVSAATGERSDGWLTIEADVGRRSGMSTVAMVLLLVAGPLGWAAILFVSLFGPFDAERLTVRVPWSAATHAAAAALRRRRRAAWSLSAAGAAVLLVGVLVPDLRADMTTMSGWVVVATLGAAVAAAAAVALVTEWRIGRSAVGVDLDASRRWVTLRNVHPAFAGAVRRDRAQAPA